MSCPRHDLGSDCNLVVLATPPNLRVATGCQNCETAIKVVVLPSVGTASSVQNFIGKLVGWRNEDFC